MLCKKAGCDSIEAQGGQLFVQRAAKQQKTISSRATPEDTLKRKLKFAQAMISSAATSVVSSDFMLILNFYAGSVG